MSGETSVIPMDRKDLYAPSTYRVFTGAFITMACTHWVLEIVNAVNKVVLTRHTGVWVGIFWLICAIATGNLTRDLRGYRVKEQVLGAAIIVYFFGFLLSGVVGLAISVEDAKLYIPLASLNIVITIIGFIFSLIVGSISVYHFFAVK